MLCLILLWQHDGNEVVRGIAQNGLHIQDFTWLMPRGRLIIADAEPSSLSECGVPCCAALYGSVHMYLAAAYITYQNSRSYFTLTPLYSHWSEWPLKDRISDFYFRQERTYYNAIRILKNEKWMPKIQFKIINPVILVSLQGQRQKFNSTVCGLLRTFS